MVKDGLSFFIHCITIIEIKHMFIRVFSNWTRFRTEVTSSNKMYYSDYMTNGCGLRKVTRSAKVPLHEILIYATG